MTYTKGLTYEDVRRIFYYKDGFLYNRIDRSNRSKRGRKIENKNSAGYTLVTLKGKVHKLHRLIFLWHHGYMPKYVDHIDGNPRNNAIENLREATHYQNHLNSRSRGGTSKYKGVSWVKHLRKWHARIMYNKQTYIIGYYESEKDAAIAYNKKALELHGDFARINDIS